MWSWGQNGSSRYAGAFAKHEGGGRIHARHAPCLLATSPALVLVPSRPRYPRHAPAPHTSRAQVMEHGDAGNEEKRRRLMEESASTDHPTLYTRAQLEEACMNAGMDATEQTYANFEAVITEKDATIDALQKERHELKKSLDEELHDYIELYTSHTSLQKEHIALRCVYEKLKTKVQDVVESSKASYALLEGLLEDSDSDSD